MVLDNHVHVNVHAAAMGPKILNATPGISDMVQDDLRLMKNGKGKEWNVAGNIRVIGYEVSF